MNGFPYTLRAIGNPQANTANVSLYFTVNDSNDAPVGGLSTTDFVAKEDGQPLDVFESAFRAEPAAGRLRVPTVLLLDLSRSVVQAGALGTVKQAAIQVVDSLSSNQQLSVVTFAGEHRVRSCFDSNIASHRAAINSITEADGIATNLYGSISEAYEMFEDGFYLPEVDSALNGDNYTCRLRADEDRVEQSSSDRPSLVAGLVIVISDGNDTAGVSSLSDALGNRENRRTLFIRVGEGLDANVANSLGNAGVIEAAGGFNDLAQAVTNAIQRTEQLNNAIYIAEYCSPKRAGQHNLFFTLAGNEPYLADNGDTDEAVHCRPSLHGMRNGQAICYRSGRNYRTCSPSTPFWCPETEKCYGSAVRAAEVCDEEGGTCVACGVQIVDDNGSEGREGDSGQLSASTGLQLIYQFSASGYSDEQCAELFSSETPTAEGNADAGFLCGDYYPCENRCAVDTDCGNACGTNNDFLNCQQNCAGMLSGEETDLAVAFTTCILRACQAEAELSESCWRPACDEEFVACFRRTP
jgi:uncharacterized protein YegL